MSVIGFGHINELWSEKIEAEFVGGEEKYLLSIIYYLLSII